MKKLGKGTIKKIVLISISSIYTIFFIMVLTMPFGSKISNYVGNIINNVRDNVSLLPKDKRIYIICHSGVRSYNAYRILSNLGYDCYNFSGGYIFYQAFSKLD